MELKCAWCGGSFKRRRERGPVPLYCRNACRQRAYEDRRQKRLIAAAVDKALKRQRISGDERITR